MAKLVLLTQHEQNATTKTQFICSFLKLITPPEVLMPHYKSKPLFFVGEWGLFASDEAEEK